MDAIGKKIKEAAKILKERGWCTGMVEDEKGRVCAVGALNMAYAGDPREFKFSEFLDAAGERIVKHLPPEFQRTGDGRDNLDNLIEWNNTTCKGKGEIIKLFRKAAKEETVTT